MNFRTLDLNLLRVFAAVMLERNVTRAAAQLAMTQPAVSNALRRLREATGDELFVTVPSGVVPTAHAAGMWPHVEAALDRLSQALYPQGFDPTRDPRTFTLAMADATATVLMPAFIDTLLRERALADVRVLPLVSRDPRPQLEQGIADIAVGFFPDVAAALAAEGAQATIALDPLYTCEYVVVMRRGHALAARPELSLDDYCAARHVRVSFAGRPRGFVDEALARAGPGAADDADGQPVLDRGAGGARVRLARGAAAQLRPGLGPGRRSGGPPVPRLAAADRGEPALAPPARARRGAALAAPELRRDRARARCLRDRGGAGRRSAGAAEPPNPSPDRPGAVAGAPLEAAAKLQSCCPRPPRPRHRPTRPTTSAGSWPARASPTSARC